ncbi:hypothetical protein CHGG_07788 [Chaetomium globosum CBS 148.51]|uniref:Cation-transporting ATPase n=1 Tax=Chaetomium globosum (strain ATCC 6205 / CBS 148.51 / DSM 1962 / NBRC 6347 / NRRL 1970) TaxID=306901 RepID=Q2GW66_CHAGB|nr:uncharacterized protein CHGG_07788 [Chaetomium globosum CBS 148.51]EAQ86535.1 hypothetical protein CHGG_07788 [Chaetomium globosum CBS 148.51]
MAHDELFAGPVAESLPTSVSAFNHRRTRADSTTSFSFYQDEDEPEEPEEPFAPSDGRPSIDDLEELPFEDDFGELDDSADLEPNAAYGDHTFLRRMSTQSRDSVHHRLLRRDSGVSAGSGYIANRHNQKLYMENEDLYIAIAGFRTSRFGFVIYCLLCLVTGGVAWLLFRWLPRWHVKLIGKTAPLRDCQWVVVENQWNEMAIVDVNSRPYGRSLSTVFGSPTKKGSYAMGEEHDPIIRDLRMIDYRYVRLFFHPVKDKLMLCTGWKDPLWLNIREIRAGIDSEEKTHRDVVFGDNLIDIEQKSWFRLLVDEVFHPFYVFQIASLILWSLDEYYYYAIAIFVISVGSITTNLIETKSENGDGEAVALAMVVRTGFNTTKGALVRSMLFPKPSGFKFYRDSFRYISVMACVALLGFTASLINFIRLGLEWHLIIIRALDLITIVVPPALPATLTIGTTFALRRLKAKQIFCISPQRVNVGGKLDLMCFDKTGTLTEEGLDILGVRVVSRAENRFTSLLTGPHDLALDNSESSGDMDHTDTRMAALHTMATCHSLRIVDNEPVGDPLDLKMFEFTGWSYDEGNMGGGNADDEEQSSLQPAVARPPTGPKHQTNGVGQDLSQNVPLELGILNSFEFVSELRRASVIVRAFGRPSGDVYVKGAPESMRGICRPETFPADYEDLLSQYTHKGYRVIACATKHIKKLSWVKAQKMKRDVVESDLDLVGFIIFENKLKPTTANVLKELADSNIGTVMVTGDNILTAISVARECGMINKTAHCYIPRFLTGDARDPNASLQWESVDNQAYQLNAKTLIPLPAPVESDASLPYDISNIRNYSIAVSGDVFRWVVDHAPPEVLRKMLVTGKVFARMSPDEKHELVEKLQSIDYSCGFCGDGANDCGALKAADVGISLSEAEASVAAPFTSRVFDIRCVPEVIREGRAALVTSFSCFKYMSLYSAIQFTSVSFLYASASNLGDFQFLFIDLALILPIAVFMSWAGPFPELCRKKPTADLVSRKVLIPLLGQISICIAIQALVFVAVRKQPWFIPPIIDHDHSHIENSENTALFLISCFEYILSGVVLNAGRPFRRSALHNWPFVATIATTLCMTLVMVLYPPAWLFKIMQFTYLR